MTTKQSILFVDDEPGVLDALRRSLRGQRDLWDMHFAESVDEALMKTDALRFDAVVTDVTMPERDGLDLLTSLQNAETTKDIPVVILTGLGDIDLKRRALELGAVDLLNKPIITEDLIARIRSVLRLKSYQDELKDHTETLEDLVRARTAELEWSRMEVIWRLAKAGEYRDEQTGNHVLRVGSYSRALAEQLGMPNDFVEMIFLASPLHDIGKIGTADTVLLKNGPLNPTEWKVMQQHCEIGYEILQCDPTGLEESMRRCGFSFDDQRRPEGNPLLNQAALIALTHHEQWGGGGYPKGLKGDEIPLEARIVAIADVYDALSHARPYKPAYCEDEVLAIMDEEAPWHFDPTAYAAFKQIKSTFQAIKREFADRPPLSEIDETSGKAA